MTAHNSLTAESNSHGTYKSYILGFILSIALTLLSYFAATSGSFTVAITYGLITLLAVAQLFVQLIFFLHLNSSEGGKWNLASFVFTVLIVAILVIGSLWVMHNMNYNMM